MTGIYVCTQVDLILFFFSYGTDGLKSDKTLSIVKEILKKKNVE